MLTIRKEQLDALTVAWERSRRRTLCLRLRQDMPVQVGAISDGELETQVDDGCKAADVLGFADTELIYRFLRLRYLPAAIWERPGAQELLIRVLADTSIDADRRLLFVEAGIVAQLG